LNTDTSNPNVLHRLETRLLVRDINGQVYGVTYKWRPDNSDADLLSNSLSEAILITNATGVSTQTWYYPSPADCLTCHTPVANYVLGVNTRQLNDNLTYPSTGATDNQLRALNRAGYLSPAFNESNIAYFEQLAAVTNQLATLKNRFRSYIDANCAECHQPGGTGPVFDARYDTSLGNQNIIYGGPGPDNTAMVVPQDIWRSEMYQRADSLVTGVKMPPLAKNLLDTNALAMMAAWINGLAGTPALAPVTITPNGGSFFSAVHVQLQAPDTNAAIYFTLDGTLPTTNYTLYSGTLTLSSNVVVSASAFRAGYNNSATVSAVFQVQPLQFTGQAFTNNVFQLAVAGAPGSNYVLQASTNLSTWLSLSTNTFLTNIFNLVDPQATNFHHRFYRVRQQ
jgi:mono/diheme cytochrome c family protein